MCLTTRTSVQSILNRDYRLKPIIGHKQNLHKLHSQIFRLRSFTLDELQNWCDEEKIGLIDSGTTLLEYLDDLVTHGLLKLEWGVYTVQ